MVFVEEKLKKIEENVNSYVVLRTFEIGTLFGDDHTVRHRIFQKALVPLRPLTSHSIMT